MVKTATVALCADDYGLSSGVSEGVLEALRAGRLSAVSALTTGPRWLEFGPKLKQGGFDADIGLHFNLTLGAPLAPMPRFAPQDAFPQVSAVIRAAMRGAAPLGEIRAELDRQIDCFEATMGRPPDFVDGHQHVQALPGIRAAVLGALAARGLQGRCWLRDSGDNAMRILSRGAQARKALIVSALAFGFAAAARRAGFATNDGFAGFSDFDPACDYAPLFASYLKARGPKHLIMCHPGHVDAELCALDPVTTTRECELAFLLSDGFADALRRRGLKLARLDAAS